MFAVSGWNVSSTGPVREQAKKQPSVAQPTEAGNQSSKRKRSDRNHDTSRKIDGRELERLWNERFGDEKSRSKQPKSNRDNDRSARPVTEGSGSADNETSEQSTGRPQKRQKVQKNVPHPSTDALAASHDSKPASLVIKKPERLPTSDVKSRQKDAKERRTVTPKGAATDASSTASRLPPPPPPASNLTPLQAKMRSKLTSARFRHLNETLYTNPSSTALSLFAATPSLFVEYHDGFSQQVASSWPRNPVDDFVASIKTRGPPSNSSNPLPRRKTQSCTIADLGCGDAPLARALIPGFTKKLKLTIHSYDLHAPNQHVTVADIARLPLRDGEADLAVFCLSLMGTNWIDFVEEAWRILRGDGKGEVWVAEVKSRFGRSDGGYRKGEAVSHSVGKQRKQPKSQKGKKKPDADAEGDEADLPVDLFTSESANQSQDDSPDLRPFIDVWTRRGFQLKPDSVDAKNKMFVSMIFFKSGIPTAGKHKGMKWNGKEYQRVGKADDDDVDKIAEGRVLKPCVYKTR
jgi:ribosomal RNA-processing protein 8